MAKTNRLKIGKMYIDEDGDVYEVLDIKKDAYNDINYYCYFYVRDGEPEEMENNYEEDIMLASNPKEIKKINLETIKVLYGNNRSVKGVEEA